MAETVCSGSKVEFTMQIEAFVEYIYELYLGFAKNVNDPFVPSSILANFETSTSGLPTISPSKMPAI